MQKQDLSKIDFGKLTLQEWQGQKFYVTTIGNQVHIRNDRRGSVAVWLKEKGWSATEYATGTFAELDQLRAICSQVDTFIETELARMNEPDWVDVKWTEVERLLKAGATMYVELSPEAGKKLVTGIVRSASAKYYADRKTVPDGVALYEPEWVEINWRDATGLSSSGATVVSEAGRVLSKKNCYLAEYNEKYKADRKTFPPGFELAKAETVKLPTVKLPEDCSWEAGEYGFRIARKVGTGTGYQYVSKDRHGRDRHAALVAAYDELHCEEEPKPEPAWLPCTREEAEGNPGESEATWGDRAAWRECDAHAMRWTLEHSGPEVPLRSRPEYRTRAKLDRWVKVPWGDVERLRKEGAEVAVSTHNGPWCSLSSKTITMKQRGLEGDAWRYQADRSTLPAGYVLGVGFVEEKAPKVKRLSLQPIQGFSRESNYLGPERFGIQLPCSVDGFREERVATVWFDVPIGFRIEDALCTDYENTKLVLEIAVKEERASK